VTLDEYQQKALATAADGGSELIQRVLGLAGESGEIADKVKRWLRDEKGDLARLDRKILAHELGDALWYVATLADCLGLRLEDVAQNNLAWRADRRSHRDADTSGGS
jgi:NTP pyrophosphatase (non-canonical NTP hydrolase)